MKKFLLSIFTFLIPFLSFAQEVTEKGLDDKVNEWFTPISNAWSGFVFTSVKFSDEVSMPIVIIWLLLAMKQLGLVVLPN